MPPVNAVSEIQYVIATEKLPCIEKSYSTNLIFKKEFT